MQLLGSGSDEELVWTDFHKKVMKYARETFSISTVSVSGSLLESKCSLENKSHHSSAKL